MASSLLEVENNQHPKVHDEKERRKEEEESFCYAMQIVMSSVLSMSMQSATELGVFDVIAKAGPGSKLSSSDIAAQMPIKNPEAPIMLDRILRLLASHSLLSCSVVADDNGSFERLYSLAPASKFFVTNKDGVSLGPLMALIQDNVFLTSWSQLKDAVLEGGIPFNRVHGTHAFEYPGLDHRFNQVFNTAMYNHTTIVIKKILDLYKGFESLEQLVDVGGGLGVTLRLITSKYPNIKAINFDLPHWILHDWSDEKCLKLLKNCYKAIPDNGKVIVVEALLPVGAETSSSVKTTSQIDVLMMTQTPGGKERSQQEFLALANAAGFNGIRFECSALASDLKCAFFGLSLGKEQKPDKSGLK
ncbi:hypothetical protein FEM48_Zijuj08G0031100 [Ziziphus jujuba var. spinosa]|uniref:Caffeic acid 3-O-methyltransferase-like n=1 Tax=Ziziphus jujuba var. spinosa TaxID=714518 RepID=A0A978UWM4_ZIZJJ|nr:hypothetical protein FEM48_Zijuj08G0031100 [Ziziphus jujuba var. spinosa]